MKPILTLLCILMSMSIDLAAANAATAQTPAPAQPQSHQAQAPAVASPAREGSFTWHTLADSAGGRRYKLYVPASYDGTRAVPLVVMLHGCTQDPDDFARGTRMNALAEEHGFLAVYPEQTAAVQPQKCWTWYDPAHQARGAGEPEAIARITREVMGSHRVDPARVFVAGVSAGGAMALNVVASYPELFAAVGVHSGIAYRAAGGVPEALGVMQHGAPDPASLGSLADAVLRARGTPIRLVAFHGAADPVVRVVNAGQLVGQWTAGLAAAPEQRGEAGGLAWVRRAWTGSDGRPRVEETVVEGLGHAWSGGSPEGTYTDARGPDASREMIRFFLGGGPGA
ncbi:MAG: PHB depolymerase family esterase [Gemmatimonadetes bacterium]|nr:PHB depolymerase family esterase [Gemmatimonadota bacterium]